MTPLECKKWVVKNTIRDFVHDHAVEICERTGIGSPQLQMIYASRMLNWTVGCFLHHGPLMEISDSRLTALVELWLKKALRLEGEMIDPQTTIIQAVNNYVAENGAWIWRKTAIGSVMEARQVILQRLRETDPGLFTDYVVCLSACELRKETWNSIDRLPELAGRPRTEDGDLIC